MSAVTHFSRFYNDSTEVLQTTGPDSPIFHGSYEYDNDVDLTSPIGDDDILFLGFELSTEDLIDDYTTSKLMDWEPDGSIHDDDTVFLSDHGNDDKSDSSVVQMDCQSSAATSSAATTPSGIAPPLVDEETSHAFFCYNKEDDEWAMNVMRNLESPSYGFRFVNHNHELDPHQTRMDAIVNAMSTAKKIVIVLTPGFMQSIWCRHENLKALRPYFADPRKVIPVILTEVDLPDFLEGITTINALSKNFLQKFVATLSQGSSNGTLLGLRSSNRVALYNGVKLGDVRSTTNGCRSRFDTIYCPDEIARRGVNIPQRDYTAAVSLMIDDPKMKCYTLWYNQPFGLLMTLVLCSLVIVGIIGNLSGFGESNGPLHIGVSTVVAIVLCLVIIGLLSLIAHYEKIKLTTQMEKPIAKANGYFTKHNVLIAMSDNLIGCWNRAVLHFIYYNLDDCKEHFKRFLNELKSNQREYNQDVTVGIDLNGSRIMENPTESEDTTRLTLDPRRAMLTADTEPRNFEEEVELILLQHSAVYTKLLIKGKLPKGQRTLHCKKGMCLCQFVARVIYNKNI
ncbi:uncharacterized protein [Antedon mediterranea]|uniref:uncharacterized protein isoform X2 n=1 Tax=Antedon mediterranea TaxID=105859 RepID=UPI003AF66319